MIEKALKSRLDGFAGLAALVSTRIYPLRVPQGESLPAVVYQQVSATRLRAMVSDPGLVRGRYQVTAFAETYLAAKDVAAQVRAALQRWRGTEAGVVVQDTFFVMASDRFDPGVTVYQVPQDFEIIYEE